MLLYIKLAVRNVHKNLKSLWLNGIGIALAVISIVFIFALSRGIMNQMVLNNIEFETGAVTLKIDKELAAYEHKETGDSMYCQISSALDALPEVTGYRPRLSVYHVMLYANDGNKRTRMEGLSPGEIPLLSGNINILEGSVDWEEMPNGIVISKGLAEEVGLALGDDCSMVVQSADGTINMQDFTVAAIFLDTSLGNKYITYTSFEQAKALFYANLPTRLLIDIADLKQAGRVKALLAGEIRHPWVEVEAYTDNLSSAQALAAINKYAWSSLVVFLLLISFVGIWAMQVENINERRREIGTLLSFGFKRRGVKGIFLLESLYISLLFLSIGLVVVVTSIHIIDAADGVYLGASASFAFGSSIIKPEMAWSDIVSAASVAFLYPLLATWLSLLAMNKLRIIKLLNEK